MLRTRDGSIRGSIKLIESLKTRKAKGKKNKDGKGEDWTWKELADMVKYTKVSVQLIPNLFPLKYFCLILFLESLPLTKTCRLSLI